MSLKLLFNFMIYKIIFIDCEVTLSGRSKRMKIKYELGFKSDTIDGKSVIQKHRLCHSAFS